MKKLLFFSFILLGTMIFCGCDDDEQIDTSLSIDSSSTQQIGADGGATKFTVKSNSAWEITKTDAWVTLSPAKGSGDAEITVTATQNTSKDERKAVITVTAGEKTDKITVTQKGDNPEPTVELSIDSSSTQEIDADGGTTKFTVKSNSEWEITKTDAWVTVSPTNGSDDAEISVTATQNTSEDERKAVITVTAGDKKEEITITQKGAGTEPDPTLKINNIPGDVTAEGATVHFDIESNSDWTITKNSADTWLSLTPQSGSGDARVTVVVNANGGVERSAQFTITAAQTVTQTVTVRQLAAEKNEGVLFELDYGKNTFQEFQEAFEGFTIIDMNGDGLNWEPFDRVPNQPPAEVYGFASYSFKAGHGNISPENYMILEPFQLGQEGKIEISMRSQEINDFREKFKVIISSEPINSDNCQDAEVLLTQTLAAGSMYENKYSIDIPESYNGGTIYVGVCHFDCVGQWYLLLSRIYITHSI